MSQKKRSEDNDAKPDNNRSHSYITYSASTSDDKDDNHSSNQQVEIRELTCYCNGCIKEKKNAEKDPNIKYVKKRYRECACWNCKNNNWQPDDVHAAFCHEVNSESEDETFDEFIVEVMRRKEQIEKDQAV